MSARGDIAFYAGAGIVALIAAAGLISFLWTPHDPLAIDIPNQLSEPSLSHWLGTDALGRDVLSMLMAGARISIIVAGLAIAVAICIGAPLGVLAAAFLGAADEALMRINDVLFAIPAIIVAILIAAAFGPGAYAVIIAIGVFNIPVFARLARSVALPLWQAGFSKAALLSGKSRMRVAFQHILPNVAPLLAVQATIQFSLAVLAEAGLSYIGLGVQPPQPSWGRLLAENQTLAASAPWLAVAPGFTVFLFVLGLNIMSDGLMKRIESPLRGAPT
ncbi:MAG: ABC transporter permease [Pseudomonadota bacterium]